MALFGTGRRAKPRQFQYEPRFYNPAEGESLRRRLRIRTKSHVKRSSPRRLIYLGLLLVIILYLFMQAG